jgi:hypothetical protein
MRSLQLDPPRLEHERGYTRRSLESDLLGKDTPRRHRAIVFPTSTPSIPTREVSRCTW